jgi:ubiquinone/menaquinone biosynthesis C-methylase UbiE
MTENAAMPVELKREVADFWDRSSCGEVYATGDSELARYEAQSRSRYQLEPYLPRFARFEEAAGRDVLEIGVGMGADHVELARSRPRTLSGVDLTPRAVEHARRRLGLYALHSELQVADAEKLPFDADRFDLVYSWGVLHHTPDTRRAIDEVHRVLRPGGCARIMIYHKHALTGYLLWVRYALLRGRPWRSLDDVYWHHLESPGTKAYTVAEARELFAKFREVACRVQLSFGDLLLGEVGQRHRGLLLGAAKALWPRSLLRRLFHGHGLYLLIEARK